jgi:hypothetical protein
MGQKGLDGAPGENGRDGRDGQEGIHGRDATQIEILEAADTTRAYARGTHVEHRGGVLRAYRNTTPGDLTEENGWRVSQDGIDEIEVEQSSTDPRSFGIAIRRTSGKIQIKTFSLPIPIHKGTFKKDVDYAEHDRVTWDGIEWRAVTTPARGEPGIGSKDWAIAVRKGRDGKDGAPGAPGERGMEGKAGPPGRDRS